MNEESGYEVISSHIYRGGTFLIFYKDDEGYYYGIGTLDNQQFTTRDYNRIMDAESAVFDIIDAFHVGQLAIRFASLSGR